VNVVLRSVDLVKGAVAVFDNSPYVPVQLRMMLRGKSSVPVMRTKNDVIEDLAITVHRGNIFVNPYRVWVRHLINCSR
jgi:hypothetical protein